MPWIIVSPKNGYRNLTFWRITAGRFSRVLWLVWHKFIAVIQLLYQLMIMKILWTPESALIQVITILKDMVNHAFKRRGMRTYCMYQQSSTTCTIRTVPWRFTAYSIVQCPVHAVQWFGVFSVAFAEFPLVDFEGWRWYFKYWLNDGAIEIRRVRFLRHRLSRMWSCSWRSGHVRFQIEETPRGAARQHVAQPQAWI